MDKAVYTFSAKDWLFFFREQLAQMPLFPSMWDPTRGNGLGENIAGLLWIRSYQDITSWVLFHVFGMNWFVIEIVIFWFAFFVIGIISIIFLTRTIFSQRSNLIYFFATVVFLLNTYIIMILSGGQLGILLAYASAPSVFASFMKLIKKTSQKQSPGHLIGNIVLSGLLLSMQVLFDPRISYITIFGVGLFFLFQSLTHFFDQRNEAIHFFAKNLMFSLIIPFVLSFLIHSFWLVPYLFYPVNPLTDVAGSLPSIGSVTFFSFADFSHALSLLHPNWPENIFGKTYFLRPEFLLIPIIAFGSLFFIRSRSQKTTENKAEQSRILFFALLGLIGAFLAKGAKEPFGFLYLWLFEWFPGFVMFRDPTKWYLLTALSYSMLVSFSLFQIFRWLNEKRKVKSEKQQLKIQNYSPHGFVIITIIYFLFLLRPFFFGQLPGTFKLQKVPGDYIQLKDFLVSQSEFFRTLWVPQKHRFGFYSQTHPAVSTFDLFKGASLSATLSILDNQVYNGVSLRKQFQELGIRYVIIPNDLQGEFFVEDRKYSQKVRDQVERLVDSVNWLGQKKKFGGITVYELSNSNDLFWMENRTDGTVSENLKWRMINPTSYAVQTETFRGGYNLIFSQRYDKNWVAQIDGEKIYAKKDGEYKNVFAMPMKKVNIITVTYEPQQVLTYSRIISAIFLGLSILLVVRYRKSI